MPVNSGAPIAAITRAAKVIDIKDGETFFHQQVMKHVLAKILTPPAMHILQVTGAVNEDDCRSATIPIGRCVNASINGSAVAGFETDDWWIDPFVSKELGNWRSGYGLVRDQRLAGIEGLVRQEIELRRFV